MKAVHTRVLSVLCSGVAFLAAACGDDASSEPTDGGTTDSGHHSAPRADAGRDAGMEPSEEDLDPLPLPFDASLPVPTGPVCALSVAAECDGDEDCAGGQLCCGDADLQTFGYTRIACQESCPRDQMHYKLCHPGETCPEAGDVCRRSQLLPYEFLSVCAPPASVPVESTGSSIPGVVQCGDATCDPQEGCCLRSRLDRSAMTREVLDPVCVARGSACTCDETPAGDAGPGADDGGADDDAG